MHPWMWNYQVWNGDYLVAKKNNIYIYNPGAKPDRSCFPAQFILDRPGNDQQLVSCQSSLNLQGTVDKPLLLKVIDRFGQVKWTFCLDSYLSMPFKSFNGVQAIILRPPQIGAQ